MRGARFCVRRVRPEELAEAAALFETVARATLPWLPQEANTAARLLEQADNETILVAVAGRAIVGLAALYEPAAFLHSLYVALDWQGRGVGIALLEATGLLVSAPLNLKVEVRNTRARAFYARHGFVEVDRGGDGPSSWVHLRRQQFAAVFAPSV